MADQVSLNIQLDVVIHQDGRDWIAVCPALDVATQADTAESAFDAIQKAVEGWFESCLDRNVLQRALAECGFERPDGSAIHSTVQSETPLHRTIQCSVPAYILSALDGTYASR